MNLADRFRESKDDPLIGDLTYGEAWASASIMAGGWASVGVYRGDRVAFMCRGGPEYLVAYLACIIGGYVACPVATEEQVDALEPALVFRTPPQIIPADSAVPTSVNHDGVFAIIHTSGTTGTSKAVCFSLDGVLGIAESFGKLSGMDRDTHMHHILMMSHNAGFVNTLFAPMMCGGRITVDTFRGINARSFKGKGNFLVLTPRIAKALLRFHKHKERHPFWNYKTIQTTAEPLSEELRHDFLEAFGVRLVDVYGTTELGGPFLVDGKILPELEYTLNGENELCVESPFRMLHYLDGTGCQSTGDIAKIVDGNIRIIGRKKERLGEELELSRKLRQKSVLERINEIKAGTATAPWVVELDPTSVCNLACPDCISIDILNQGGFSSPYLIQLAEDMVGAGVRAVILIGGGEPMAHKAFGAIVEIFGSNGLHVGVTTNGTLLDRYQGVLAEHARWVRVSMDAGTPETYLRFRPAPNNVCRFNDVVSQMERYVGVKSGKLGYSFLILTHGDGVSNVGDIYEAGRLAKEIGCDYFEVKPSYDMDHYLIPQSKDNIETAKEQISALRFLADDGFRVITPATLESVLRGERLHQPKEYTSCAVSDMRTLVTPTGAYICPYFRGNEKGKIGDLTKQSFAEMWGNRPKKIDPSKDCRFHCIRHESNLILGGESTGGAEVEDYDFFV